MKMPELPKRTPKAPSAGRGSSIQPPAFVTDLFKDMRDRRLIIPAIALLIAIIAVPVVLSTSADPFVPPPPLAIDPDAAAVEPGVLAVQEVGVRDFRERLDALKRKNPFGDRFEPKAPTSGTGGELVDPVEVSGTGGGAGGSTGATVPAGEIAPTTPQSSDPPQPVTPPEPFVLVPRVNVEVGVVDRDRRETRENVKSGDLLPSKQAPTAMYLSNTNDSEFAEFLVSRDVERINGEGECKPGRNRCEFLRLADGESAYLRFADGKRYVIRVTEIYFVQVDEDEFNKQN
ncbi:MAG: hypothetical protein M3355_00140 [Actinomycetota bacterium]|nr:hypothetical protein [Actinomycetota bacterium]